MAQKPIYISANEFNEKIKNNLRDFYVYQFKRFRNDSTSAYRKKGTADPKPASTFTEEKQRLMAMLEPHGQIQWQQEKGGICCCTADTRLLADNPFWEPYRFCAPPASNHMAWFLQQVLLCHPRICLRNDQGLAEPAIPKLLAPFRSDAAARLRSMSRENLKSWLDAQISLHYPDPDWGNLCLERYFATHRTRLNGRTMTLEPDPENRGISRQLLQALSDRISPFDRLDPDQFKSRLTQQQHLFLKPVRLSQRKELWSPPTNFLNIQSFDKQTRWQLQQLLAYFSRTMPLGFLGYRLQKRLGKEESIFRHKNSYIIQALNDYNLWDLLEAIRLKKWICIESRNGRTLQLQSYECLPLQIRESTLSGRQYLLYYHGGYRSIGTIRLDYIDKLRYGTVTPCSYFDRDLEQARQLLPHIWGCSVPGFYKGNLLHTKLCQVELLLRPEKPYVQTRLNREARFGQLLTEEEGILRYRVQVADPREMIPWIRSLGGSLLSVTVDGVSYPIDTPDPAQTLAERLPREDTGDIPQPEPVAFREDPQADYPHEQLFTWAFSALFDALGDTLCAMFKQPDRYYREEDIRHFLRKSWDGAPLQKELEDLLFENIKALCTDNRGKDLRLKYIPEEGFQIQSIFQLLSLTGPESAWLSGVLAHPMAKLFLTDAQLQTLRLGIGADTAPIDFQTLLLFDQYSDVTPVYTQEKTRQHFKTLLASIYTGTQVQVCYESQLGPEQHRLSVSGFLYSKTENKFWALCTDDAGTVSRRNLERFTAVQPTQVPANAPSVTQLLEDITEENSRSLTLLFTDEKNRAERLVSEFSPWPKRCTCSTQTEPALYRMEVRYDVMDTQQLQLRLRHYGPEVTAI